jgi:hypothetical protein
MRAGDVDYRLLNKEKEVRLGKNLAAAKSSLILKTT